jgi:hypothetical protein
VSAFFYLLSWLLCASDVERLGDDHFSIRQQASGRLGSCNLLAYPLLDRARQHADPEVRQRASVLLASMECPLRDYYWDLQAWYWIHVGENPSLDLEQVRVWRTLPTEVDWAVVRIARHMKWLHASEQTPVELAARDIHGGDWVGSLNVIRRRARGLPDEPYGH